MDNEIINKELNKELNKEQLKERDLNQEKNEFDTDLKQNGELHKTEKEIIQTEQEVPAEQLKRSKLSKEEDGFIQKKDEFDLSQLGLGLDLSNFKIDCSEASMREAVKTALHEYLEIRKKVLEGKDENELTDGERAEFGEAYERLVRNVDDYVAMHGEQAKHGKAQKQLKRMARIKELIHIDNRFFMLSKSRRKMMDSMDADNEDTTGFPTLLKAVHYADNISNRNQFYKDNRKKQKEAGKLPELSQRSKEWWKTAMKNNWDRTKAAYNVTGGLIDRTIGIGTMIASNTLILGGKIVKLPIKLLSMAFNKLSKKYKSQKRWTVDYSITKGWAGLTEGRQIFRDCAKGLAALPVGVYDSLVHGFPYLFRKMAGKSKENDKVYRTSGRLFKGIGERIAGIIYSLGFNKNYVDLNKPDDAITDSSKEKDKSLLKTDEKREEEKKEEKEEDKKEEEKKEDKKEDNKEEKKEDKKEDNKKENKEEKKEDNKEEKEEKIDEEQINSEFDDILENFKDEDEEEQSEGDKTSEKAEKKIEPLNKIVISPSEVKKLEKNVDVFTIFSTAKSKIKKRKTSKALTDYTTEYEVRSADGKLRIKGLFIDRIKAAVQSRFGLGKTDEEWLSILRRLDAVENMKQNNLSVEDANAQMDEAVTALKEHYYQHLKKIEATYGKKLTQMHPYDVFRMFGDDFPAVMEDFAVLQDLVQLIEDGKKYFDPKNKEDQDFINLSNYYNSVYNNVLALYASNSQVNQKTGKAEKLTKNTIELLSVGNEGYAKAYDFVKEDVVHGPSLTEEEEKAYIKDLRKRSAKEGWKDRLFGRYSTEFAGKELNEDEIRKQDKQRRNKENDVALMKKPFKHFNFSLDKIRNLKGAPDYAKIVGKQGNTLRRRTEEVQEGLQLNRVVTDVGKTVVEKGVKKQAGEVKVYGMYTIRLATNLRNTPGEGRDNEELKSILRRLDGPANKEQNGLTEEEANKQFAEAFSELKEIYYVHLKRLENNYGKLLSQIHPYDLLRMMGDNYYKIREDFIILQDAMQMMRCKKPYFDMENKKDREFNKLACYYCNVFLGVLDAFGQHGLVGDKFTDDLKKRYAEANEKGMISFGNVTDKDIKGASLTKEQQKEYIKDLRRRAREEGWDDKLFGRFEDPKVKPINRNVLSTPELKVPESLETAYSDLEKKYKNAAKEDMKKMRSITKSSYEFNRGIKYAISKDYFEYMKKKENLGIDPQGLLCLMRPVKVNKDGHPEDADEAQKLHDNMDECYQFITGDLKARKPLLNRVLKDAKEMVFTVEELKDPKFIVKNRNRAIRHLAFMNNLTALYDSYSEYYLKDKSVKQADRDFMFMLVKGTDYINYSSEMIHQALFGNGLKCTYVGEKPLSDEVTKKTNKKARKVMSLEHGARQIYFKETKNAAGNVDPNVSEEIIRKYLTPYKDKPSLSVRKTVALGMESYLDSKKDQIKNIVGYKKETAEEKKDENKGNNEDKK